MTIADIKKTTETKMGQSIAAFSNSLTKIRTGRPSPSLLDAVQVDSTARWCRSAKWPTCHCWTPAP